MNSAPRNGRFIVFEGGDGAGKTTQARLLADALQRTQPGHAVILTAEPGGTDLGRRIRDLVLTHDMTPKAETLLYLADRAEHVETLIRPALDRGDTVVCDRFTDSTLAYQGRGRGLSLSLLDRTSTWACGHLRPDIVIVLDIDPSTGLTRTTRRGDTNRFDAEDLAFHHSVRAAYRQIVRDQQWRRRADDAWGTRTPAYLLVDASADQETVAATILDQVSAILTANQETHRP